MAFLACICFDWLQARQSCKHRERGDANCAKSDTACLAAYLEKHFKKLLKIQLLYEKNHIAASLEKQFERFMEKSNYYMKKNYIAASLKEHFYVP